MTLFKTNPPHELTALNGTLEDGRGRRNSEVQGATRYASRATMLTVSQSRNSEERIIIDDGPWSQPC